MLCYFLLYNKVLIVEQGEEATEERGVPFSSKLKLKHDLLKV